jgi:uncharacterized protein DUF4265
MIVSNADTSQMPQDEDRGSEPVRPLVKIRFDLDALDWHGHGSETLWAEPLAERGADVFVVRNSPFFTRGVNYLDIVMASPTDHLDVYAFRSVVEQGGHSTYMLLFEPGDVRVPSYWALVEDVGCSFESMTVRLSMGVRTLYSVDVPEHADLTEVYRLLARGEAMGLWVFQEGYAHISGRRGLVQKS